MSGSHIVYGKPNDRGQFTYFDNAQVNQDKTEVTLYDEGFPNALPMSCDAQSTCTIAGFSFAAEGDGATLFIRLGQKTAVVKFADLASLNEFVNLEEGFILQVDNDNALPFESATGLGGFVNSQKSTPTSISLIVITNTPEGTKAETFTAPKWGDIKSYLSKLGETRKEKRTKEEVRREIVSEARWLKLRTGLGLNRSFWQYFPNQFKYPPENIRQNYPERYRADTTAALVGESTDNHIYEDALTGLDAFAYFYLGQPFVGFGPRLHWSGNGDFYRTSAMLDLNWDILATLWKDNPPFDIVLGGGAGVSHIDGDFVADHRRSLPHHNESTSGLWQGNLSVLARLFEITDGWYFKPGVTGYFSGTFWDDWDVCEHGVCAGGYFDAGAILTVALERSRAEEGVEEHREIKEIDNPDYYERTAGDHRLRPTTWAEKVEPAPKPKPEPEPAPKIEPQAQVPAMHTLEGLEPIKLEKRIEFLVGQARPRDEANAAIISGLPGEIVAKLNERYAGNIPNGYILVIRTIGHASSDDTVKSNQALSTARAAYVKEELYKLIEAQGLGSGVSLEIKKENFSSIGHGEEQPKDSSGNIITGFGGHENHGNMVKDSDGKDKFVLCKGADPKMHHTKCRKENQIEEDVQASRRVELQIELQPPESVITRPSYLDVPDEQRQANLQPLTELMTIIKGEKMYTDPNTGLKKIVVDPWDSSLTIVLDDKGYETARPKIKKALLDSARKAKQKKLALTDSCTIRFVYMTAKDEPADFQQQMRDTFFVSSHDWPFAPAGIEVIYDRGEFKKEGAEGRVKDGAAEREYAKIKGNVADIPGRKLFVMPIGDMARLTAEETEKIKLAVVRFTRKKQFPVVYINSAEGYNEQKLLSIARVIRAPYPRLDRFYETSDATADPATGIKFGNYIVLIPMTQDEPAIDLSADSGAELRKAIFGKLREISGK